MASVKSSLSSRVDGDGRAEILLRVTVGRGAQFRIKSGIRVRPDRWRDGAIIMPRGNRAEAAELVETDARLRDLTGRIIRFCAQRDKGDVTKQDLEDLAGYKHMDPDDRLTMPALLARLDAIPGRRRRSEMKRNYACGAWERFADYQEKVWGRDVRDLRRFSKQTGEDFVDYLLHEGDLRRHHGLGGNPRIINKGESSVNVVTEVVRSLLRDGEAAGLLDVDPVITRLQEAPEGTPYFLTSEERDLIAAHDYGTKPRNRNRDVFVLHCLLGCRVSDLQALRPSNVGEEALEYVPKKTSYRSGSVVRIPLTDRVRGLLAGVMTERGIRCDWRGYRRTTVKRLIRDAGIERLVTVINPRTHQEERRPIWEVANTHIARRTFIGNLYKKVKDPALIGSMTGHVEGSQSFRRYRAIDDDMKREVLGLL